MEKWEYLTLRQHIAVANYPTQAEDPGFDEQISKLGQDYWVLVQVQPMIGREGLTVGFLYVFKRPVE